MATTDIETGQHLTLHTYLAVRETALDLYGFIDQEDLAMFELLLGVPKVGPKSALQILSQASVALLTEAAHKNDSVYLHKLSGIGKKTAENVTQFLANKIEQLPQTTTNHTLNDAEQDAIDALIALGYDIGSARDAIGSIATEGLTTNQLVTEALKRI